MIIDVITDDANLERLWADWTLLWDVTGSASPFVSPMWLRPWWRQFGTAQPVVAVAHTGSRLCGILPLYRLDNVVLPLGVGISDDFDALLAPNADAGTLDALLSATVGRFPDARFDFPELRGGAALRTVAAPPGWQVREWDSSPRPVLALQPTPALPKSIQRDLRQAQHRANRIGGWRIDYVDATDFAAGFATLGHLHGLRWQERGENGVLQDPRVRRFHLDAGPQLVAAGLACLAILHLRDQAAAAIYSLFEPRRMLFYLSGFDPAFRFESPGTILLGHLIQAAFEAGRTEADFLRGGERYKYAWGGRDQFNQGRSFVRQ